MLGLRIDKGLAKINRNKNPQNVIRVDIFAENSFFGMLHCLPKQPKQDCEVLCHFLWVRQWEIAAAFTNAF